jgi:hypothetical protein
MTIEVFNFEPNWESPIGTTYEFITTVNTSETGKEQRTPLRDFARRRQTATFFEKERRNSIVDFVRSHHATPFYVPIYIEPMRPEYPQTLGNDFSSLICNDLTYYYNLANLTTKLCFLDFMEFDYFTADYSSHSGNNLYFDTIAGFTLLAKDMIVFPLMYCYMSQFQKIGISDGLTEYAVEFTEYF